MEYNHNCLAGDHSHSFDAEKHAHRAPGHDHTGPPDSALGGVWTGNRPLRDGPVLTTARSWVPFTIIALSTVSASALLAVAWWAI